ncbi:hypothetical protein GCM10009545_19190 [Saccharopolyspora thermophila]|uniref:Uncharacterized protein n=1 Tax=Saccharopolyspora thermophila TaxID=89367 RepID=A0ABN1CEP3_9PSEU
MARRARTRATGGAVDASTSGDAGGLSGATAAGRSRSARCRRCSRDRPTSAAGRIAESLHLRTGGTEGRRSYRNPLARRRDTLAFLDDTVESALALAAES